MIQDEGSRQEVSL
jgi:hypothetical protein